MNVTIDGVALADVETKTTLNAALSVIQSELSARDMIETAEANAERLSRRYYEAKDRGRPDPDPDNPDPVPPPAWEQPVIGYPRDYLVTHNGQVWQSIHPNNVWEPGTEHGQTWVQVVEEPAPGEYVAWGIGQVVVVGDLRTHEGHVWKAKVDHTTHAGWVPSAATPTVWEDMGPVDGGGTDPEPPAQQYVAWAVGQAVVVGDLRTHEGKLWSCKTAHTTHAGWVPSAATHAIWQDMGPVPA